MSLLCTWLVDLEDYISRRKEGILLIRSGNQRVLKLDGYPGRYVENATGKPNERDSWAEPGESPRLHCTQVTTTERHPGNHQLMAFVLTPAKNNISSIIIIRKPSTTNSSKHPGP